MRLTAIGIMLVLLGAPTSARARVPNEFSVQGILRDGSGRLQTLPINVTVALYDAASGGGLLAGPFIITNVPVTNGLFTVTVTDAALVQEVSPAPEVWLELTAGNDTFPRQKVTANLFALQCSTADVATNALQLGGRDASDYQLKLSSGCTAGTTIAAIAPDGTVACAPAAQATGGFVSNALGLRQAGYPQAGSVAHIDVSPPAAGIVTVIATFRLYIRNRNASNTIIGCTMTQQLATSPATLDSAASGYLQTFFPSTINTQDTAGGAYLQIPGSLTVSLPTDGTPLSIYLNGSSNCIDYFWNDVNFTAQYFPKQLTGRVVAQ